ncbi:hypothetical protein KD902_12945, partial [Enterococcus faecium]|uniref:hypothetical protein n=1 Tax=Enterococcus faecium TaxID=1352 RepID=UPI003D1FDC20
LWLKTLYRKRAVTWPFIFYTIIWTLSKKTVAIPTINQFEFRKHLLSLIKSTTRNLSGLIRLFILAK